MTLMVYILAFVLECTAECGEGLGRWFTNYFCKFWMLEIIFAEIGAWGSDVGIVVISLIIYVKIVE